MRNEEAVIQFVNRSIWHLLYVFFLFFTACKEKKGTGNVISAERMLRIVDRSAFAEYLEMCRLLGYESHDLATTDKYKMSKASENEDKGNSVSYTNSDGDILVEFTTFEPALYEQLIRELEKLGFKIKNNYYRKDRLRVHIAADKRDENTTFHEFIFFKLLDAERDPAEY